MSVQMTLWDTGTAPSSPGLPGGSSPSNSPSGQLTVKSGRGAAPANPSAAPGLLRDFSTRGTYGPLFIGSSPSAVLQSSLESRLRARMDGHGSPEYELTWKTWVMPSGPPICALRASARRTSANGCTGWPTPTAARDAQDGDASQALVKHRLRDVAMLSGWPTPAANEYEPQDLDRMLARRAECKERTGNGNGFGLTLGQAASLLAGWNTPRATDGSNGGPNQAGGALSHDAALAGWPTPTASMTTEQDLAVALTAGNGSASRRQAALRMGLVSGPTPSSSPAPTAGRGALAPAFSLWLQGFPPRWMDAAPSAASVRSKRRATR